MQDLENQNVLCSNRNALSFNRNALRSIFTARKRSLGQGYVFSRVCDSVHSGGGCTSAGTQAGTPLAGTPWAGTPWQVYPLGRYTPQAGTPPRQVHPQQVHPPAGTPPGQVHSLGRLPPGRYTPSRYIPPAGTPLGRYTLPGRCTPLCQCMLGYGQQAGSTHPTGMHSCLVEFYAICCSWLLLTKILIKLDLYRIYRKSLHSQKVQTILSFS